MIIFLIVIALILIIFNYRAVKKENNSFKDILRVNEESPEDYMLEIINLRKDFGETITELQKEIIDLKVHNKNIITNSYKPINKELINDDDIHIDIYNDKDYSNNNENTNSEVKSKVEEKITNEKVKKVKILSQQGLTIDEICAQLSLGKGEVLLIKELYLK